MSPELSIIHGLFISDSLPDASQDPDTRHDSQTLCQSSCRRAQTKMVTNGVSYFFYSTRHGLGSSLNKVKIPRCLRKADPVKSRGIVTFVDASQQAYGAAVYMRCEYENESVASRVIAAKSKVVPLNPITVPRLELIAQS